MEVTMIERTDIRKSAEELLEKMSEKELLALVMLLEPRYTARSADVRKKAFANLEALRRHVPDLDEKEMLKEYREGKYGQ